MNKVLDTHPSFIVYSFLCLWSVFMFSCFLQKRLPTATIMNQSGSLLGKKTKNKKTTSTASQSSLSCHLDKKKAVKRYILLRFYFKTSDFSRACGSARLTVQDQEKLSHKIVFSRHFCCGAARRQLSWRRFGKLANKSGLFWTDTGLWSDQGTRVA